MTRRTSRHLCAPIQRATVEILEERRLLSAPTVNAPPTPDGDTNIPDGHFYLDTSARMVYDFNQSVTIGSNALTLTNVTTGVAPPSLTASGSGSHHEFLINASEADLESNMTGNFDAVLNGDLVTNGSDEKLNGDGSGAGSDNVSSFFFLPGDANHDRSVDGLDYGQIDGAVHMHFPSPGYFNGDFTLDNTIDGIDYGIIDGSINTNYGTYLPPPVTMPNELTATAATGSGEITLNWQPPAAPAQYDGFGIWRSDDGGVTYSMIDREWAIDLTQAIDGSFSWTDTGLPDGAKYTYRIRAYSDSDGYSVTSNKYASVTTLPGPSSVEASLISSSGVMLTWDDNTDGNDGYDIIETKPDKSEVTIHLDDVTYYQVTGLDSASSYEFRVQAVNDAQKSGLSPGVSVFTLSEGQPTAPSGLIAAPDSDPHTIHLIWTDNSDDEAGFDIEQLQDDETWSVVKSVDPDETSTDVTGLNSGAAYTFRAIARGATHEHSDHTTFLAANSPPSDPDGATTEYENGGLVFEGRPGDTPQTWDGVRLDSWSPNNNGPFKNGGMSLNVSHLPKHSQIFAGATGWGFTEEGNGKVTLDVAGVSDWDFVGQNTGWYASAHKDHKDDSLTVSLTGSDLSGPNDGWFLLSQGVTLSVGKESIAGSADTITTRISPTVPGLSEGTGIASISHTVPGSNNPQALHYKITKVTPPPTPGYAGARIKISDQNPHLIGGVTDLELKYIGPPPPGAVGGIAFTVKFQATEDPDLTCTMSVTVK